jgi:hypothetical protein
MVFIVRVRTGFTRSLAAKLTGSGSEDTFRVLIDGPYGSGSDELRAFDSVLLCVGGSGIAWALGVLQALVGHGHGQNQAKDQGKEPRQRQVSLIWAIRDIGSQRWAAAELAALKSKVDIRVYVTGEDVAESTTGGKASDEKQEHVTSLAELTPTASGSGSASGSPSEVGKVSAGSTLPTLPGRPDMSALIAQYVVDAPSRGASTVAIAACGPDTLITDCANAVARAQVDVLRGRGVEEVYLCTEAYGW